MKRSTDAYEIDDAGLEKLIKALKHLPSARVGILAGGGKNTRKEEGAPTNAAVGAAHEYGTSELPVRSFLRQPISEHLNSELQSVGTFTKSTLKEVIRSGSAVAWMKTITTAAEAVVAQAFHTGGFGKWAPSDMTHKEVQQTLVESQQLRNSITSEVVE